MKKKVNKELVKKILIMILGVLAISLVTTLILYLCNIIYFEDGINFNAELFHSFKNTWYGGIGFILLQTVLTILLCAIPGFSMAFIVLCTALFDSPAYAFILAFSSVMISSVVMYVLGRFGGYKICEKMLGEEDCKNATELLHNKGTVYFPLMMAFPAFPDDALVMIAGVSKMSLKWFIPSIVVGRGVGVATIVFGLSLIPFASFTSFYDWFVFITICVFWIIVIFYLASRLNKYMEKKREENK